MKKEPEDELAFLNEMTDEELMAWMKNFQENLPAVLEKLGMPQSAADGLNEKRLAYENAVFEEKLVKGDDPLQLPHYDERRKD